MSITDLLHDAEDKMKKSVEATRHEFTLIRTGRANPALLEHVVVVAYGSELPLNQVATVTTPDARQLLITPFDRNQLGAIEKGILKSDVNLTPNNDGNAIRLNIPPLNEERRKEFIKLLHKKAEAGHAAVRNVRHHSMNRLRDMQKAKEISEDDEKRTGDKLQKLTDQYIAEIDKHTKQKEQDLLEV
jgi:ribosome recycling factor